MTDPASTVAESQASTGALGGKGLVGAQLLMLAGFVLLEVAIRGLGLPEVLPPEQAIVMLAGLLSGVQITALVFLLASLVGQGIRLYRRNRSVEAEHD